MFVYEYFFQLGSEFPSVKADFLFFFIYDQAF